MTSPLLITTKLELQIIMNLIRLKEYIVVANILYRLFFLLMVLGSSPAFSFFSSSTLFSLLHILAVKSVTTCQVTKLPLHSLTGLACAADFKTRFKQWNIPKRWGFFPNIKMLHGSVQH